MKTKNEVFNILYLIYFIILPLIFSKSIIDPVLVPRQIHLAVFCIMTLMAMVFKSEKSNEINFNSSLKYLPLALLFFALSTLVSVSQARVLSESYFVTTRMFTTILFFYITTILLIKEELSINTLYKGVICFAGISILIAAYQILNGHEVNLVSSTMANKNLFSSVMFLCIPFILFFQNQWKYYKYFKSIFLVIIVLVLFYIRTRAVIIPLVIGGSVYLAYNIYEVIKKKEKSKTIMFLTLAIVSLSIFGVYFKSCSSLGSFTDSNTFNTRIKLWHNTKHIIADNTLLGVGPGNWKFEFANYGIGNLLKEASDGRMIYQQPHNDFLEFFADCGVVAFLSYVGLFIIAGYFLIQLYKNAKSDKENHQEIICLIALIGFAFISFFDFPMERIEHQVLFFTFLAIILYRYNAIVKLNEMPKINFSKGLNTLFFVLAFFVSTVSIFVGYKRYVGEKQTVQIFAAHANGDWANLIRLVDDTKNDYYETDPMSIPLDWYKGVAQFSMDDFQNAKITFERAFKIAPYNIHVLNNLASTYEKLGFHDFAIKHYLESIRISPDFEESILNLSAVYFNTNNIQKAFETIEKCPVTSMDPKYPVFLKAILRQWLNQNSNDRIKQALSNMSDDEIMKVYISSKQKNTNFTNDISKYQQL